MVDLDVVAKSFFFFFFLLRIRNLDAELSHLLFTEVKRTVALADSPDRNSLLRFQESKRDHCGRARAAHADVMLGCCLMLCPPSDWDKGELLLFMLLATSGYCC